MRRSPSFLFLVLFILLPFATGLRAAIEKDLGQSLAYIRVTDTIADQPLLLDTIAKRAALVIDLRSVGGEAGFVKAFHSALAKTPPAHAARFVLVNAETSASLFAALEDDDLVSVITLAPRSASFAVDIKIAITPEEDARAMKALAEGTEVEKLVSNTREKRRYDEAKLVHDHTNGTSAADADQAADAEDDSVKSDTADDKKESATDKKAVVQPPYDAVLARAIHLHRALLALKKL